MLQCKADSTLVVIRFNWQCSPWAFTRFIYQAREAVRRSESPTNHLFDTEFLLTDVCFRHGESWISMKLTVSS